MTPFQVCYGITVMLRHILSCPVHSFDDEYCLGVADANLTIPASSSTNLVTQSFFTHRFPMRGLFSFLAQ